MFDLFSPSELNTCYDCVLLKILLTYSCIGLIYFNYIVESHQTERQFFKFPNASEAFVRQQPPRR